jgi:hypothetical protein
LAIDPAICSAFDLSLVLPFHCTEHFAMWLYWRRALAASWAQTMEWLRWGSWPQFILRVGSAAIIAIAIGWLCGPAASLTTVRGTLAAIAIAAVVFLPVYLAAIAVTAARLDREKESRLAGFNASLARHNERQEIGRRLKMLWERGNRLRREFSNLPNSRQLLKLGVALSPRRGWRADVDAWIEKVEREANGLSQGEVFLLRSFGRTDAATEDIQGVFAALEARLSNLRLAVDRFLRPMD